MIIEAHLISATSIRWGEEELRHRVPVYALCRVLKARGITGTLIVYGVQGTKSLIVDIDWGAAHTVQENNQGLRLRKWEPFDGADTQPEGLDSC